MRRLVTAAKIFGVLLIVVVIGAVAFMFIAASGYEAKNTFADEPAPSVSVSRDPLVIARGRYLAHGPAHCSQCHGDYQRDRPQDNVDDIALSGGFEFAMGPIGTTWAANITPAGIGVRSDAHVARAIAAGVLHDGTLSVFMRYSGANLSSEDLTAVLSYLRSLPPVEKKVARGELTTMGKAMFSFFEMAPDRKPLPQHVAESDEPSVARGAYLAEHVSLCVACHTKYDPTTFEPNGPKAGGGVVEPSHGPDSDKEFAPPNLTSSSTGATGKLTEDQFIARIKHGRAFASSTMPWENFGRMTESDLRSVYRYLKSLPPIDNDMGPSYRDVGWQKE